MGVRLRIGDFSRMTYLSVKALRHYHEVGLLEPAEVEFGTGYRLYAPEQVPVAQVIRRLRELGMSLDAVRAVVHAPDVESRNAAMVEHLRGMERELQRTQATVASLRELLEHRPAAIDVAYRAAGAASVLAISEQVAMEHSQQWWAEAFAELHAVVARSHARRTGVDGALYFPEFFQADAGRVVAFVPVAGEPPASGRAQPFELSAGELAVTVHRGAFANVDQTYGALGTYVAERAIGLDGPIREHYLVGPGDTDDEAEHRTEVCWPVFQTTPTRDS